MVVQSTFLSHQEKKREFDLRALAKKVIVKEKKDLLFRRVEKSPFDNFKPSKSKEMEKEKMNKSDYWSTQAEEERLKITEEIALTVAGLKSIHRNCGQQIEDDNQELDKLEETRSSGINAEYGSPFVNKKSRSNAF
eukprot:TRINITY_DN8947_c0_g2_i1.p1 TRINITY_DN8947_c0_g2~~TRINITY_DN8947_c0_g2_i1.p1  ORF type:complete len:136 (-),score=38.72 TRINITY_DN8947_c0_g2_i1:636-1043(-)